MTTVQVSAGWIRQYIGVLGIKPVQPSAAFLATICKAQLTTIPFETFTRLAYSRTYAETGYRIPSVPTWISNVATLGHGGACVEQNRSLRDLLCALGFEAWCVRLAAGHFGVVVRIPAEPGLLHYVDCGAAAPLFESFQLRPYPSQEQAFLGESIDLAPEGSRFRFTRRRGERVVEDDWNFDPNAHATDEEMLALGTIFAGGTPVKMLRYFLFDLERQRTVSLLNNTVTIRYADRHEKQKAANIDELEALVANVLGRPHLPTRTAVAVLAQHGVDVFASAEAQMMQAVAARKLIRGGAP